MNLFKKIENYMRRSEFKTWERFNASKEQSYNAAQRRLKRKIKDINKDIIEFGIRLDVVEVQN